MSSRLRRTSLAALAGTVALAAAGVPARPAEAGDFALRGTVVRVVDGDTVVVRVSASRRETVRLLGVDTPERGDCFGAAATAAARRLANGRAVRLRGDATQATRDRYGRLLAYASLPGGADLGRELLARGFGRVYVYGRPFARVAAYRRAEAGARRRALGLWGACAPPAGGAECHPSYTPCLPVVGDLDCSQIDDAKKPITIRGSDPYRLDGDGDGLGCE